MADSTSATGSSSGRRDIVTSDNCEKIKLVCFIFIAALGAISFGIALVYSSPLLGDLLSRDNFTLWEDGFRECAYQTLIGPMAPLGATFGGIISALAVTAFGLVYSMQICGCIFLLGWAMLGSSNFVASPDAFRGLILTGRTITGFAQGWIVAILPIYIAEVAPEKWRGKLQILMQVAVGVGSFLTFILAYVLEDYWKLAYIFAGFSLAHACLLFFLKESPKRSKNIFKNLRFASFSFSLKSHCTLKPEMCKGFSRHLTIIVILYCFQQITGITVISFYATPIFVAGGADSWSIDPQLAASISIGLSQIIGPLFSILFIERVGRKVLLFFGAIGMAIGSAGLATYFAVVDGFDFSSRNDTDECLFKVTVNSAEGQVFSPLAIVSVAIFVLSFAICWSSPMYILGAEVFPDRIRGVGVGISITCNRITASVVALVFPIMSRALGLAIPIYVLTFLSILAAIYVVFFVPETKGKPLGLVFYNKISIVRNIRDFIEYAKVMFCLKNQWAVYELNEVQDPYKGRSCLNCWYKREQYQLNSVPFEGPLQVTIPDALSHRTIAETRL